jgi:hypothetical protein
MEVEVYHSLVSKPLTTCTLAYCTMQSNDKSESKQEVERENCNKFHTNTQMLMLIVVVSRSLKEEE